MYGTLLSAASEMSLHHVWSPDAHEMERVDEQRFKYSSSFNTEYEIFSCYWS